MSMTIIKRAKKIDKTSGGDYSSSKATCLGGDTMIRRDFTSRRQKAIQALKGKGKGLKTFTTFAIISPDNPDGIKASKAENEAARARMEKMLQRDGLQYFKGVGHYNDVERSYIIFYISLDEAVQYAADFKQESFIFAHVEGEPTEDYFPVTFEYWENIADNNEHEYELKDKIQGYDMIAEDQGSDNISYYTMFGKKFKFNIPFPMFASVSAEHKEKLSRLSETYARNFAKYVEKSCSDGRTWLSRKAARSAIYFGDNPLRTNHARDAKLDALLGK